MRAIVQRSFGGPDVLRLEDVPDPHPGDDEVRIRVHACGVQLLDAVVRRGETTNPLPPPELPMIPGREVAGVIDEVGAGVDGSLLGCRAVVDLSPRNGGYAELAVAPVGSLHLLPEEIDADAAVAMVGTGRTALAILEVAQPSLNDVAVVTAAGSGVGSLLVQGLHAQGAMVVALAGKKEKLELASRLGASIVLDYSGEGWIDALHSALGDRSLTLALDGIGGEIGRTVLELLGIGGRLVMFGSASGRLTEVSSTDLYRLGVTVSAAIGARLLRRDGGLRPLEGAALEAAMHGRLRPIIGQSFLLAEAAAAHRALESRETIGKTVLHP